MVTRRRKPPIKKKEEIDPKDKCCRECQFAYLMRSEKWNPIVAECTKTKERFVASTCQTNCKTFKKREGEMVINEMIFLNR